VRGQFGTSTHDFTADGRIIERTTTQSYILTTTVGPVRYILNCDVLKDSTQYSHIYTFVPEETPTLIYEGRSINKFQNVTLTC